MNEKATLDAKDIEILKLLQEDCTQQYKEIALKVGSPVTTVYSKIKRMRSSGIIKSCKAVLDAEKFGLGLTAFVLLTFAKLLPQTEPDEETGRKSAAIAVAKKLKEYEGVQEVHILTGPWDVLVKVKVPPKSLSPLILDKIREMEAIDQSMTTIVLEPIKETSDISLPKTAGL